MLSKFFELVKVYQSDIVLGLAVIFISVISFQTGKIYALNQIKTPIEIKEGNNYAGSQNQTADIAGKTAKTINTTNTQVVSSKNSNKYHFPWCPGAGKISDQNKITFPTESAAIASGLTLAGNCKK